MENIDNWVIKEISKVNFGNKRLNKEYAEILNSLSNVPNNSITTSL